MKVTSSLAQFLELSINGVQDIAPISSLSLSNESTQRNKAALGIKSSTPDFDRFMDTIEIEHAKLIADELDIDVKSAHSTFASAIVNQSIQANLKAPFTRLERQDFSLIATVLKAPQRAKVIPSGDFGFAIGGLATVRNILGHCYVCIEEIVETTANEYCNYELQLYGFFKIKSQNECIGILDDLDKFDLSFDIDFANPSTFIGGGYGTNQATLANESEGGVPLDLILKNWNGAEDLIIDFAIQNNSPTPANENVNYGYYDPSALMIDPGSATRNAAFQVTQTIPAGTLSAHTATLPILTEDQYSKDTPFIVVILSVKTASGNVLFQYDRRDANTYKIYGFTLLDNDQLPLANFGNFTGTLASGETKTIPVNLSKLPSPPLRSVAKVNLSQDEPNTVQFVGSNNVVFSQGEGLTKNITITNTGDTVKSFTLTLEAVENCEVGNNGTANFVTTNEDIAIAFFNPTQTTSTNNRELPISIQRSGNNGEVEVVLEQAISNLDVGVDYIFIDEDGSETTELPRIYIPANVNSVTVPFLRFLKESVPQDVTETFTIASATDRDEAANVLFDENQTAAFTQIFYQRTLTALTDALNGADEIIITPTFDNQIADNKTDQFKAVVHASTEIAANETEVTLGINRNVSTAQLRGFTIPSGQRFQDQTFRYTLVKIGEVLQFSEAVVHEVVIPANALAQDPNANFTSQEDAINPGTFQFTDTSTQGTFPIASYAWNFGDGSSSADQNPNHTFASPGVYQVSLTVTDNQGNTHTRIKSIEFVQPYTRTLTQLDLALNNAEELILTTSFDNIDSGSILQDQFKAVVHASSGIAANESEVTLTFDRSSGTAALRSFTFADERFTTETFRFTLVKIGDVLQFNEATVYEIEIPANAVVASPTANFNFEHPDGFQNHVAFSDASTQGTFPIASYAWDLGDGNTATGSDVFHNYGVADVFTVTLTVTDTEGNTGSVTKQVPSVSNLSPTADFTLTRAANHAGMTLDGSSSSDPDGDSLTYSTAGDNDVFGNAISNAVQSVDNNLFSNTHTAKLRVSDGEFTDEKVQQYFTPTMSLNGFIQQDDRGGNAFVFKVLANISQPIGYNDNAPAGEVDVHQIRIATTEGSGGGAYHPYFDHTPPSVIYTEYGIGDEFTVTSPDGQAPIDGGNEAGAIAGAAANPNRVYYYQEGRNVVFYIGLERQGTHYASSPAALFYIEFHQDQLNGNHTYTLTAEGSTNFYSRFNTNSINLQAFLA